MCVHCKFFLTRYDTRYICLHTLLHSYKARVSLPCKTKACGCSRMFLNGVSYIIYAMQSAMICFAMVPGLASRALIGLPCLTVSESALPHIIIWADCLRPTLFYPGRLVLPPTRCLFALATPYAHARCCLEFIPLFLLSYCLFLPCLAPPKLGWLPPGAPTCLSPSLNSVGLS
jgi:hypothetical protein